jgi:enterochelin esterase-like enzyme
MHRVLAFVLLLSISCKDQTHTNFNKKGKIERIEDFQSAFVQSRNIDVWLPDDYNNDKKYAVLYLQDGQMLFDSSQTWNNQEWGADECMSKLIQEGKIENTIVVGIWNNEFRHSEYFPQKPFEKLDEHFRKSLLNSDENLFKAPVYSDGYIDFMVNELKPYIDDNYSTYSSKQHTYVAGSSMGALISLYALCEYPDVFGGAACLSTHWLGTFESENNPIPGQFLSYLQYSLPPPQDHHKIYFDYGTATLDALYEPYQLLVDSIIQLKGFDKDWTTLKLEGADHSENSWRSRLDKPINFLLSPDSID